MAARLRALVKMSADKRFPFRECRCGGPLIFAHRRRERWDGLRIDDLDQRETGGSAKATRLPPAGRPDFPPPAEMTTYCRPLTM